MWKTYPGGRVLRMSAISRSSPPVRCIARMHEHPHPHLSSIAATASVTFMIPCKLDSSCTSYLRSSRLHISCIRTYRGDPLKGKDVNLLCWLAIRESIPLPTQLTPQLVQNECILRECLFKTTLEKQGFPRLAGKLDPLSNPYSAYGMYSRVT